MCRMTRLCVSRLPLVPLANSLPPSRIAPDYGFFGCGSYFEGRPTYGLSDIDLIIVLHAGVKRSDVASRELAHAYGRVRRGFPFLGGWGEKEANLIFLSEVLTGFPAPESFCVRLKTSRLVPLWGQPLPADLISGP